MSGITVEELFAALKANTEATIANTAIVERVLVGQEAALAKLEGGTTARKPRTPKADAAPATETGATTTTTTAPAVETAPAAGPFMLETEANNETDPKGNPKPEWRASDFSEAQVKGEFAGYLGTITDPEKRKGFVSSITSQFGVVKPFGPDGVKTDEQRQQVLFFVRRARAGLPIDFNADYDFNDDPEQGGGAPEVEAEDDLG